MGDLLRRSDGRLRAGWRLSLVLLALATGAGGLAAVLYLSHYPKQRSGGVLQPFPLLGTAVLVLGLVVVVTWALLHFIERRPLATIGLAPRRAWRTGIPCGLALGSIVPLGVTVALLTTGHATVGSAGVDGTEVLRATLPMVLTTMLLSSWEEIAYRGYALQLLNEIGGMRFGLAVSGILFGLTHAGNPGANPLGLANTALNGALLGWIVCRTGSLWLACGYHAGWNLMAANFLGLRDSGMVNPGSLLLTTLSGPDWLSGGAYGFEGSVITGVLEAVVLSTMIVLSSRLPQVAEARPYFSGSGGS